MSRSQYDTFISIFSPDGRLYQVEYAFKSIKGPALTSVGLRGEKCSIVVTQRKVPDKLLRPETVTHVFNITKTIGCVITGRISDGKALVFRARQEASQFWYNYGHEMPISALAKRMADIAQLSTQYVGSRPMGVAMILVGMEMDDDGALRPKVFKVDPAGSYLGWFATASGQKETEAINFLEKKHRGGKMETLSNEDTIMLGISTLQSVLATDFKAAELEVGIVSEEDASFQLLAEADIDKYLTAIAEKD
uniref:Proteasome subunit alpha type n=1 Tax=Eutreptiella gymnastica TaxID=73025 RepID=A0A7S1II13_9EUGL|mmetsp:Transcript_19027/g.33627  ORF Transcript_19027/g.33627 Transcript_19027/m.33627 type:complete len:250 (+) Transcript_19027:57-806(+)